MPKPNIKELEAQLNAKDKKQAAKDTYSRMLEEKFQLGKWFAEQGDDYKRDVAASLSPGGVATAYKKGDVASFNKNASREAVIAKAQAINYMRGTGLYNTPEYAYDRGKVFLSDTGYLSDLIPILGENLSQSQKTDAEMDRIRQQTAETSGRWLDLKNASNDTELDRWYNVLMADYLLGDRNELFDFEKIDARYSAMSDEEYDKEYKRLTDQWDNLDWEALTGSKANNYKSNTSDIQAALEVVQGEVNRRSEFEVLRANIHSDPNFETLSAYDGHEHAEGSWAAKNPDAYDHYYDQLYFINNPVLPEGFKSRSSQDWIDHYQLFGYDLMTPQEVKEYTYLVEENRMEDAARYIELLQPELNARKADIENAEKTVRAQHLGYGALDSAGTVLTNPLAAISTAAGAVLGIDDPNHPIYSLQRGNTTTRSVYGQTLGELAPSAKLFDQNVLTMGYNVLMSLGDMAMARSIGGGLSKATGGGTNFAKNAMQFIMSTESAANTYLKDLNRGWAHDQAIIHGLANGLIEAWTERGFMDSLFSEGGTFLSRFMKSGIAEGWEEIESGGLQLISDALIAKMGNDPSQVEEVYQAFAATMSESDAARHTLLYFANQLAADGLSGFASGAFMQAGTTAVQDAQYRSTGRNPLKNGDIEGILRFADNYTNKSDVADAANKVRDKQAKGFKVTARDMGELVHSLSNAIGEKNSKAVTDVLVDSVEGRLEELGETPENAKKLAQSISNMYLGKKITMAERAGLKWSDAASQVFKELNSTETVSKEVVPGAVAGTEGQMEDGRYVAGDAVGAEKNRVGRKWRNTAEARIQAVNMDTIAERARLQEATTTKTSTTTTVGKAHDKAKNLMKGKPKMGTREITAVTADGEEATGTFERVERKNGKLLMVMKDASDTEVKVDADKITNGGDEGILTIINYAQEGARHEMSTDEINTMIKTYLHEGGDVDSFVQQFQDNYLSGYSGVNAPAGTISGGIASIAYEHGKAEAIKDEADRVARAQKARKVETPSVGWLGDVTSDMSIKGLCDAGGLDEAVKNMTTTQQAMVEFGRHLAKSAKINVVFFASKAGADGKYTTQNGSYDPNTHTIYLDINSGASTEKGRQKLMKRGDLGAAIGRVAGHELTHVLEATSPEYYAKYKQAVKAALKAKNLDYASLVREKIDAALATGEKLTYAGAEAEVIADASEYMLQDSKFVKNMDQGLKGKVKEIVQKFLNKVNEAFRTLTGGHIESAVLRTMTDGVSHYEKQLQDLWDMAFDEMLGAEVRTEAPAAEMPNEVEKVQKSRERDDAYMAAVERGDTVTAQKMVDEAAKKAGYEPLKLYHGTRSFGFKKFDINRMDDKMSIFVTDNERIAESYSGSGANRNLKNAITEDRYDFINKPSKDLEPYVQEYVDKNLRTPTEKELRNYTDEQSATILEAVDAAQKYWDEHDKTLNHDAQQALAYMVFYGNKLAQIPTLKMEDETDGYALRMKYEDAKFDLSYSSKEASEALGEISGRPVIEAANRLIDARFSDPFYNEADGSFVSKWKTTDKLEDKLFSGVYELYGDQSNLLEIDAKDSNWNKIDGGLIERPGVWVTTREVAKYAKQHGYSGVRINNVRDGGGMTAYQGASNVSIYFDNTSLKSADPVTYDDSGNVIPLSERFNAANEDIRYSIRDGLITTESTEQERYNVLKNAMLKLAHVNIDRLEGEDLEQYNTRKKSDVEKPFLKLAAKLGITKVNLENSYIDFPFRFSNGNLRKNLKHQLERGGTFEDHAKMMSCLEELVDNAIPIEMHPEKKNGTKRANPSLRNVYVLISAYRDGSDIVPVQLEVKEFWNNDNGLYVAVALTKMTPEVVEKPAARKTGVTALLFSEDTISLRYLFENVNSADYKFFKYIPDGFLNDEQKAAKVRALGDQAEEYASYGKDDDSSPDGIEIDDDTESAYPTQKSIRTWAESDYVAHRNEAAERLAKTIGVSTSKAKKWIDDVNSISAYILGNKARLDYIPTAVKGMSAFKSNPEYGGSIDMSTICAKRRLATGTLDAIQRVLGDAVLTKDDFLHIREMMKERGHEVACGLCFVESSRKNLSKYNKQFLDQYKTEHPDSELGMVDLNTVEGLERIRSNPETADVYTAYEKFMNKLAQRKPKLFEKRTEYNHEILKKFKSDTTVGVKNRNGGLRLQSFSDFEIVHLIDMMQVITDMASVGLAGQAYTKVPDFAWALGDTGLKINLSLIAKDVDADGTLIFDDVEGMNHLEAEKLRNAYSKNVGTIVVTFTDEQTIAAMKSDFIDYIIPFHRSQWQKGDYKKLGLPEGTKDYTIHQNEKEGRKRVKENFLPNAYWQDDLSGTENAEYYLDMCAKAGRTPKFAKFLVNNGDGSYSLQPDGSTDGYWKLLIDFKMYDNDGNRSKQLPVQPNFNMDQAMRMLEEYKGEHDSFPVAQDVVDAFVKEYRGDVGGVKNTNGRYTVSPVQKSIRDLPEDTVTYRDYLTEADSSIAATIEERNALSIYQKLLKNHAEASEKVIEAEAALAAADEAHKPEARKVLAAARVKQKDLYNRLLNVERQAHVQTLVKRSNQIIGDLYGKDQAELDKMLADKERRIASLKADLTGLKGAARTQREADIREQEREVAALKSKATKALLANSERYQKQIDEIRLRRDLNIEIGKRTRHIKRIVKRLNDRIIHEEDYKNVKESLKPTVHKLVQTFIDGFGNIVFDQKTADRLRSVYDEIANEDGAPEFYSDDVANWLSELSDMKEWDALIRAEGSSSLGAAEEKLTAYSKVAEIADHIYKLVTAADEIFIDGKREKFNAFSTETGTALIEHKDSKLLVGKARDAYNAFQNLLVKGNLTPQFFFEHLKNSGMTRLFDGLMRGQTEYAQAIREGQEAISDAKKRYNFYSWQNMKTGVQFRTEQGHDIVLTVPVMMSIYATAKREAANKLMDTHHLDQGGFRYDEKNIPRQKGKPWKAAPGSDLLHKLSQADVEKISNTLTAEQKACADELVSYLSNECAAKGNRASMELYGIKKYNEEYYFPFKTDSNQRNQRSDAGAASTTNDARVKHTSFTHSLRKGANTPLVMGDFFDVIADHINLMATYSSFVVPIESMNRVMNTKINEEADGSGNDVTIRSLIGRKYGEASQKYIADLLKDLNGGPQTDNRGGLSALFRAFKRGAVMGSLSVTLQQPTAIIRAFAYVNPKYFAHITMEGNKKTWERMMKHSGTAVIKDMGKFDVGTGHMANDWIANSDIQEYKVLQRARFLMNTEGWKAVKDNTIEFLTSMPGVMDRITWTHIWKAVEAEQADQHPGMDRNSDEFLDMVGKRFDDVINHTQVYDSVLAKSQNMRSKNSLAQMSTAFMSEPTLNANLYYSAVTGDHTAGQRAGIIASVIASNILAAAMASLISAWNKDDDDRKFTEKYLAAFASRAVDNLNPMTMYPYLSDLWSAFSGYDIERTDLSVVTDILDYGGTFIKKIADGEEITWRDRENFYGTIANLFGIPGKNVSRDIRRIRNLINTDKSASSPSAIKYTLYENAIPLGLWKDSSKAYCQRLVAAVADGDKQEAYDLWDYLTNTKKPSQNTINTNVRDELKRRVQEGSLTPEQATEILRKYAPYKNDKDNLNKPKEWAE